MQTTKAEANTKSKYLFRAGDISALHAEHERAVGRQFAMHGLGVIRALPVSQLIVIAFRGHRNISDNHR